MGKWVSWSMRNLLNQQPTTRSFHIPAAGASGMSQDDEEF